MGATLNSIPQFMVDTADGSGTRAYLVVNDRIFESTDGLIWNLFLTNSKSTIYGIGIWNGYVVYPSRYDIGRTPVGDASLKDDDYFPAVDDENEYRPVILQGGTLKVGGGRYVASIDEAWNLTAHALKLPEGYRIRVLADHFSNLFMGTRYGLGA